MRSTAKRTGRIRQTLVVLFCLGLTADFAYHAIKGRHGLEARSRLVERSSTLEREIRSLRAVRSRLERDVVLLSAAIPDPDIVEEIAREVLAFGRPGDVVVEIPRKAR